MTRVRLIAGVGVAVVVAVFAAVFSGATREREGTRQTPTVAAVASPTPSPSPVPITLAEAGIDASELDRSADPCGDFHRFACGSWLDRTSATRSKAFATLREDNRDLVLELIESARAEPFDDPARERVGNYFDACMRAGSTPDLSPLRPFLSAIDAADGPEGLAHAVAALHRIDVPVLFQLSAVRDTSDLRSVVPHLASEGLYVSVDSGVIGLRFMAVTDANLHEERVEKRLLALGLGPDEARTAAKDAVRITLALQLTLRDAPWKRRESVDVATLKTRADRFAWDVYFADMGGVSWTKAEVAPKEHLDKLQDVLSRESNAAIRHTLMVALFDEFDLLTLRDRTTSERRWWCTREVERALGDDLGRLYVANRFNDNRRLVAWGIAGSVAEGLKSAVDGVAWLDDPSREGTRARVDDLALLIGYPNQPRDYGFVPRRDAWIASQVEARMSAVKDELAQIGKPVDRWRWRVPASTVNAYYAPVDNQLVFPAGILVSPFFGAELPAAVNYGAIGTVMGHELTHGLVAYGGTFHVHGTEGDRWTADTHGRVEKVKQCFVSHYSRYRTSAGWHDGKATVMEDIADVGGIQLSWNAWTAMRAKDRRPRVVADGFTEEQLFFLSYAQLFCQKGDAREKRDRHSPGRLRVLGPLTNTSAFGLAFGCKAGDAMQAEERCTVW